MPASARFERTLRWVQADEVTKVADPRAGTRRARVKLTSARPFGQDAVASPADEVVDLYEPYVAHARKASDAKRGFVAGIGDDGEIYILAGVDGTGDVAFVGDCQYRQMTVAFDRYVGAKGAGRKPVDVLRAVATTSEKKDFAAFFASKPAPAWEELPPARRQIDEAGTPKSVLATLKRVELAYEIPESWRTHGDIGLCSRLPIGWGECTLIKDVAAPKEPIPFQSYALVGESIELWAVNDRGDLTAPLGRLGVVPADAVARAVSGKRTLVIRPAPGIETYDQFRAAMAEGKTTLELAEVR